MTSMTRLFFCRSVFLLFVAVIVLETSGCNNEPIRSTVTGTVTYNDKPVTVGTVRFFNRETKIGARCTLDESGKYSFPSPIPVGEYQVCIIDPPPPPPGGMASGQASKPQKLSVPEKYRSFESSGLKFTIEKGPNVYDIKLE